MINEGFRLGVMRPRRRQEPWFRQTGLGRVWVSGHEDGNEGMVQEMFLM